MTTCVPKTLPIPEGDCQVCPEDPGSGALIDSDAAAIPNTPVVAPAPGQILASLTFDTLVGDVVQLDSSLDVSSTGGGASVFFWMMDGSFTALPPAYTPATVIGAGARTGVSIPARAVIASSGPHTFQLVGALLGGDMTVESGLIVGYQFRSPPA